MNQQEKNRLIAERRFDELFYNQGFDDAPQSGETVALPLPEHEDFTARVIMQKRGFAVCVCEDDRLPALTDAQKNRLQRQLERIHYEHLLILCGKDEDGQERQYWSISIRPQNRPPKLLTVEWRQGQEQLLQEKLAGLIFPVSEEEGLTISGVVERVRESFAVNSERVTRKFYKNFKEELTKFDDFISGIDSMVDKKQYAALMLNRLMFIYFIQKKQFLDGDIHYLRNRLKRVQQQYGKNQFHNRFYREFLRRLFTEGLNTPAERRSGEANALIGRVPYLNGGLFDAHQLETENPEINILDAAFEGLFAFFDAYQWHLDSRPAASRNEINPDVLGYIFEKYINDRAEMGAYYTQEDITEYIAKNTLLPYLLQQAREGCKHAFNSDTGIWRFLRENPDNYIYDAVKRGCHLPDSALPKTIRAVISDKGKNLIEKQQGWNALAPQEFALARETWREVIARRGRCSALREKISSGGITQAEDLITDNLDIMRFVRDALLHYEGSDFISAFFCAIAGVRHEWTKGSNLKAKRGMSILDPACGSGAFLFAALNILQPLYEVCVDRMRDFVDADDRKIQERGGRERYPLFRKVLADIRRHPNTKYWICKTIILENLYGVDIMPEAAEIAKLRLFLQLAAVAVYDADDKNLGLEPLPDIDYNIRAGNSLVGFTSLRHFEEATQRMLNLDSKLINKVRRQAAEVERANAAFRLAQDNGFGEYEGRKKALGEKLAALNETLNHYLAASTCGAAPDDQVSEYQQWYASCRPFHWLAEFYGIIEENGGFDAVIGNPPYVEYAKVRAKYKISGYTTEGCGNLYAYFIELSDKLIKDNSMHGMIVPISLPSTPRMSAARKLLEESSASLHISHYADSPTGLFTGVFQKLTIFIRQKGNSIGITHTTAFMRWYQASRGGLFNTLHYLAVPHEVMQPEWKKYNSHLEVTAREKILRHDASISDIMLPQKPPQDFIYLNARLKHWVKCLLNEQRSNEFKAFYSKDDFTAELCMALFNSSLFFWFWETMSDGWHLTKRERDSFKVNVSCLIRDKEALSALGRELNTDLEDKKVYIGSKQTEYEYKHKLSKAIIDKIDVVLAPHYGLSAEELDFIINYCYKYRLGLSNEE